MKVFSDLEIEKILKDLEHPGRNCECYAWGPYECACDDAGWPSGRETAELIRYLLTFKTAHTELFLKELNETTQGYCDETK